MAGYTFFFLREDRAVPDFVFGEYENDAEALAAAGDTLEARPKAKAVEVRQGETLVGKLRRQPS